MKITENECVGCPPEIGCLGDACPHRNMTRYYCDNCGEEAELYDYDGEQLCAECVLSNYEKIGD